MDKHEFLEQKWLPLAAVSGLSNVDVEGKREECFKMIKNNRPMKQYKEEQPQLLASLGKIIELCDTAIQHRGNIK